MSFRSMTQVIIISDTFTQFAGPLMKKLGYPTIFCNTLEVAEDGEITGFKMRIREFQADYGQRHCSQSAMRRSQAATATTILA